MVWSHSFIQDTFENIMFEKRFAENNFYLLHIYNSNIEKKFGSAKNICYIFTIETVC